jgi:hypothetical protein
MGRRHHGIAVLLHGGRSGFIVKCGASIGGLDKNRGFIASVLIFIVVSHARAAAAFTGIQQRCACSCLRNAPQ